MKKVIVILTVTFLTFGVISCTEENITPKTADSGQTISTEKF